MKIIPFGKFKGTPIDQLPAGYLQWLYWQDFLNHDLSEAVCREIVNRWPEKFSLPARYQTRRQSKTSKDFKLAVQSAFRELSFLHHPDRGGDVAAMRAVIEFKEKLMQAL